MCKYCEHIHKMVQESFNKVLLNEENVYNGGEKISNTKEMIIKPSILIGTFYLDYNKWKISPETGLKIDNLDDIEKYTVNRINIMANHLNGTLTAFESKMNNLDSDIQLRHEQLQPFEYTCDVVAAYYMPPLKDMWRERAEQESKSLAVWCKENYGRASWDYHPKSSHIINFKRTAGVVPIFIKVAEFTATGYRTNVSFEMPGYQLGGMDYVGLVVPYVNSTEEGGQYADVKLTDEFSSNLELLNYLKKTSSHLRCDGCGRMTSRDTYFIFQDESGKLHYYGKTCAQKIFGINIIEKLYRFMMGLNKIGESFASKCDDFNMQEERIKKIIGGMLKLNVLTAQKFDYRNVLDAFYMEQDNGQAFMKEHETEINEKYNDFMINGHAFFEQMKPNGNDFEEKLKAFGLGFTSGNMEVFRKIPQWVMPYALNKYFRFAILQKRNAVADQNGNIQPYGDFGGYKIFYGTILEINAVKNYHIVMAKVSDAPNDEEKYGIMWYEFREVNVSVGDKVTVYGSYSKYNRRGSKFTTIEKQKLVKGIENRETNNNKKANYDIGQRLRDCPVTIKKVFPNSIIVTTEDGFDFFIYTRVYGEDKSKFDIDFYEGQKLSVTGTIQMSNNNKIYLNRCKISVNESMRRLFKLINETVNLVLRDML